MKVYDFTEFGFSHVHTDVYADIEGHDYLAWDMAPYIRRECEERGIPIPIGVLAIEQSHRAYKRKMAQPVNKLPSSPHDPNPDVPWD